MEETPKKILESRRCFICSKEVQKKENIYVFGKSSFDFPSIITSGLDVNVNCYSGTSELFICKAACYGRLTKFKRTFVNLEVLKPELQGIYKDPKKQRNKEAPIRSSYKNETSAK
jgi:hypothetical protein